MQQQQQSLEMMQKQQQLEAQNAQNAQGAQNITSPQRTVSSHYVDQDSQAVQRASTTFTADELAQEEAKQ